jgi:hypothetical protein
MHSSLVLFVKSLPSQIENQKSKIENPLAASIAGRQPPPLQSLRPLWPTVRFSPIFKAVQSNSKQTFSP